jgi:hypothetical protein
MPRPRPSQLIDLALGRLDPATRDRVEAAVRADPDLGRTVQAIRRNLEGWDRLPAPPPPPAFAAIASRLEGRAPWPRAARAHRRLLAGAVAVAATLVLAILLAGPDRPPPRRLVAEVPERFVLDPRVEAVLEGELAAHGPERVSLARGRAWFRVGPGPFRVDTPHGPVEVLGTTFEVDVRGGLRVAVAEGLVTTHGQRVGPGRRFAPGEPAPLPLEEPVGAWFERPRLHLEGPDLVRAGEPVELRFVLENPTRLQQAVGGPDGVQAALWISVEGPAGGVRDLAVADGDGFGGGGGALVLAPGERRAHAVRLAGAQAFGEAGLHRCRAMYRPSDGSAVVSEPLVVEVR